MRTYKLTGKESIAIYDLINKQMEDLEDDLNLKLARLLEKQEGLDMNDLTKRSEYLTKARQVFFAG